MTGRVPPDVPKVLALVQRLADEALALGKPESFWPYMSKELCGYVGSDRATLFQVTRGGKLVSCFTPDEPAPIKIEGSEGIAGTCAREQKSVVCNDAYADARFSSRIDKLTGYKTKNLLAVPLIAQGRTVGVVELINKDGGFSDDDVAAMEFLGPQIATYFILFSVEEKRTQLDLQLLQLEKMAAVGRVVAGFTHEVRNPLMVIMGFCDKMKADLEQKRPSDPAADIEKIKSNARRIEHLVQNLLGFSRASRESRGPIDLRGLIETTLELVLVESKWKQIPVAKELDPAVPPVTGDVNTLMQVFLNLIVNAFQAMDGREGARLTLRVRAAADGKEVVAEVEDTGPGMTEEVREKLFEPFFTTKGAQGTGLGLYIVAGIVQNHRGRLTVASEPGKGTTFTVALPATAPAAEAARPA